MSNDNPNPDEQSWDVFRYVTEEMTPEEEQRFEQLLETDQALREQVASMVSTLALVDQAHATSKVSPAIDSVTKRGAKLRVRRLIVSVAALVAIAALAMNLIPSPSKSDIETELVAMAWAESLESDEFELPEQEDNFEFASFEVESDDDWIADMVTAVSENSVN